MEHQLESIRLKYKDDDFGNPIDARVTWKKNHHGKRPIAMIYHAGGLVLGSCEIIPKNQVQWFAEKGFVVVMPNYRLVPQVTGKVCFEDAEDAFHWARGGLVDLMRERDIEIDVENVVALGHSSGGSMVLHLAGLMKEGLKAVMSMYPFVLVSDKSTSAHKGSDFFPKIEGPTEEEWKEVCPEGRQLTEVPFEMKSPRARWMQGVFREGRWMTSVQPDGDYLSIDPVGRCEKDGARGWVPTMLISGSEDFVPGRSPELIRRAGEVLKKARVEVEVEIVQGAGHLFDHNVLDGNGERWDVVERGFKWLVNWVEEN